MSEILGGPRPEGFPRRPHGERERLGTHRLCPRPRGLPRDAGHRFERGAGLQAASEVLG
jgi:hypothetical protein